MGNGNMKQTEEDILNQHYQQQYQNMNNMNNNMNNLQLQRQNMNNLNNPQLQNQNMNLNMNNMNQNMNNLNNPQIQNQNIINPQLQRQNIPKRQIMMIPQMPMMVMQQQPIMIMNGQRVIMSSPMLMLRGPNRILMFNGNNLINNNIPHQRRRNEDGFLEPEVGNKKMSMTDIEKLGIEIYDKTKHYSNTKCMICLDDFEDKCELRRLDCLHIFHKNCIDSWLKEHGNCPIDQILVDI